MIPNTSFIVSFLPQSWSTLTSVLLSLTTLASSLHLHPSIHILITPQLITPHPITPHLIIHLTVSILRYSYLNICFKISTCSSFWLSDVFLVNTLLLDLILGPSRIWKEIKITIQYDAWSKWDESKRKLESWFPIESTWAFRRAAATWLILLTTPAPWTSLLSSCCAHCTWA